QLLGADPGGDGQLDGGGGAAQLGGEELAGRGDGTGPGANGAARPVEGAQLVDEGATDAGRRIAIEGNAPLGFEVPGGHRQAGHARRQEVVTGDVRRDAGRRLVDHLADQVEVVADELFLCGCG